jgi:hypothetical protein
MGRGHVLNQEIINLATFSGKSNRGGKGLGKGKATASTPAQASTSTAAPTLSYYQKKNQKEVDDLIREVTISDEPTTSSKRVTKSSSQKK